MNNEDNAGAEKNLSLNLTELQFVLDGNALDLEIGTNENPEMQC